MVPKLALVLTLLFFAADPLSPPIQQKLAAKYPRHTINNSCPGKFLGSNTSALVALHNKATREFLIVWVPTAGDIQELDTIPEFESTTTPFEFECMGPKEARELQQTLRTSEAIESNFNLPRNSGAACYFISETLARCWALDRPTGRLINIGGWET